MLSPIFDFVSLLRDLVSGRHQPAFFYQINRTTNNRVGLSRPHVYDKDLATRTLKLCHWACNVTVAIVTFFIWCDDTVATKWGPTTRLVEGAVIHVADQDSFFVTQALT
jgi:hypothetical protein